MGGHQAGAIGALTVLASQNDIIAAVSYSDELTIVLDSFGIESYPTIRNENFIASLKNADLLLCVHGREIVKPEVLVQPRFGAVNIHPYLYKYKGVDPVGRAFRDGEFRGSVGAHIMEERIDSGPVLVEDFVDISKADSIIEIYNRLYPYYAVVILKVLIIVSDRLFNNK